MNNEKNYFLFNTQRDNQYIYDPVSNRVYYSPDPIPIVLDLYPSDSLEDIESALKGTYPLKRIEDSYNIVKSWYQNYGAFSNKNSRVPKKTYSKQDYINDTKHLTTLQITLNVIEDCNLRCKYCVYGGDYFYNRKHSKKKMTFEIAKKSIDYYIENYCNPNYLKHFPKSLSIGFYGGEPLLNFDLIKKCVDYVNSNYDLHDILVFNLTTNGILLTKKIVKFLVDNDFGLLVSLDGPKEEHDRNRITKNNKGSFDVVYKNLKIIKNNYPEYFSQNINIASCHDWKTDLINLKDFFDNNGFSVAIASAIGSFGTDYYQQFSKEDYKNYSENYKKILKCYISQNGNKENNSSPFIDSYFSLDQGNSLNRNQFQSITRYTGICTIGAKLFVACDGSFHICVYVVRTSRTLSVRS